MMGQAQANRPEGQPDAKNPNKEYKLYIDQKKKSTSFTGKIPIYMAYHNRPFLNI